MKEEKATEYTYEYNPDPDLDPSINAAESMRMDHLRVGMGPTTEDARRVVLNLLAVQAAEASVRSLAGLPPPREPQAGEQCTLWPGVPGWPGTTFNGPNGEGR